MNSFKIFRIHEREGKTVAGFEQAQLEDLDAGEVVVKVAYSSVNYKDALAGTGAGKVIRRFPCVGGIDLSGTVVESSDARFAKGDAVIATSFDLGVSHDGGYAEYARIPADWLVRAPRGMSLKHAMVIGTAGYTAALGVARMEHNGLAPQNGPVIVNGATGGVGSVAIDILAQRGYRVTALTGKDSESDYLRRIGASEVMLRSSIDVAKIRPLDKALWAGGVDNLGGDTLAWMLSTMQQSATVASIGLAANHAWKASVMPFILRGVSLLGIDSGYTPNPQRQQIWDRLADDLKPAHLDDMVRVIPFSQLPDVFQDFLDAKVRGRIVVDINE
jgi:putative YhdH/YhfP family quinone oxidoreductase